MDRLTLHRGELMLLVLTVAAISPFCFPFWAQYHPVQEWATADAFLAEQSVVG